MLGRPQHGGANEVEKKCEYYLYYPVEFSGTLPLESPLAVKFSDAEKPAAFK